MGDIGTFAKGFAGGFIGKLAGTLFIAVCLFLGFGLSRDQLNVSQPDKQTWSVVALTSLPPTVCYEINGLRRYFIARKRSM
jgi:hypothetical protein